MRYLPLLFAVGTNSQPRPQGLLGIQTLGRHFEYREDPGEEVANSGYFVHAPVIFTGHPQSLKRWKKVESTYFLFCPWHVFNSRLCNRKRESAALVG